MIRIDKFVRSLVFAALAGLATVPYLLFAMPVVGPLRAMAMGSVLAVAVYVAAVSPNAQRALRYAVAALVLGGGLMLLAPPIVVLFGSAMVLGLLRSGVVYRAKIGRAFLLETVVFLVAVGTARLLAGATVLSYGLAVWGFFLVQSAFFLFAGMHPRREATSDEDPFERARREATRLMEELPG